MYKCFIENCQQTFKNCDEVNVVSKSPCVIAIICRFLILKDAIFHSRCEGDFRVDYRYNQDMGMYIEKSRLHKDIN
jgi:hypothetical protein